VRKIGSKPATEHYTFKKARVQKAGFVNLHSGYPTRNPTKYLRAGLSNKVQIGICQS